MYLTTGGVLIVAPRAGAWIETKYVDVERGDEDSRTPRGCVD